MSSGNRPLSPHLGIYRWRITMLASTLHRMTGLIISLGLFFLVIKLLNLASSGVLGFSPVWWLARAFWFIWTLCIYFHLCNGIRHLLWDVGYGFDIPKAEKSAKIALIAALFLTISTWLVF